MPDLADGETAEMQGSGSKPYILKNAGGVFSCTCPAWRNQSVPIERRTCKHLRKYRGDAAEEARIGGDAPLPSRKPTVDEKGEDSAPPVLLAESWNNSQNLAGWWMSEKLDGVRAYWDGTQFLSRNGNIYMAPDWFIADLPKTPLDGELWMGRKMFQKTSGLVRRTDKPDGWKDVKFVLFDAPAEKAPFEERLKYLADLTKSLASKYTELLEQVTCRDVDHLREELAKVEAMGGEGLMLREPGSHYTAGRSSTLLKVKTFHDSEAVVIGHEAGKGKHKGKVGSLLVRWADGTEFSIGTGLSDAERAKPPAVGAVVNFRYQEKTDGGVPRFPSFIGLREDVKVEEADAPATPSVKAKGKKKK